MRTSAMTWTLRCLWLVLPFTLGSAIGAAVAGRSRPVQITATIGSWTVWSAGTVALLVVLPAALSVIRSLAPAALGAGAVALSLTDGLRPTGTIGLVAAALAGVAAWSGWVADDFVDGASYGDERRFALRAPAGVVVGPIPFIWIAAALGSAAGALLLAAGQVAGGIAACVVGVAAAIVGARSLHALSERFVVFVPAGVTLVDPLFLVDAVLFARRDIRSIGPATTDHTLVDLSGGAIGLALALETLVPQTLTVRRGRREGEEIDAQGVVIGPARPAAVIAEARRRSIG